MSIGTRTKQGGMVFGDWKIYQHVGSGSGGRTAVFQIKRSNFDWEETSALKVVNIIEEEGQLSQLSKTYKNTYEEECKRLCREAQMEVRLMYQMQGSMNVVNYLDYKFSDWEEENCFGYDLLVRMEFLDCLKNLVKQKDQYSEGEVIQIGKDICKALVSCHKENIIHRDIKPGNIFVNSQGYYKLGDFGIARILDFSGNASTIKGTYAYAAPEQFRRNRGERYDHRVDIYSLGLTLYELLNGNRLPFAQSSYVREEDIELRIGGGQIPAPLNAGNELTKVILKACAFKREERFQSAQEFLNALEKIENQTNYGQLISEKKMEPDPYDTVPATAGNKVEPAPYDTVPATVGNKEQNKFNKWFGKAMGWFRRITDMEEQEIQNNLENHYYDKHGVRKDENQTVKRYQKPYEQESASFQNYLGNRYYHGKGVEQDYKEAAKWYQKSAEQGYAPAQINLANCYYYGTGIEQNYEKAVEWWMKSAEQGDSEAQNSLANCYCNGTGIKRDYKEAVKWYQKSAEQGYASAQCTLGFCYYCGKGIEKNYIEAVEWWMKSAERGNSEAQYSLANCYYNGKGIKKDYKEAVEWWVKSAERGNSEAQYKLGNCYYNGTGVEQNYKEAVRWYGKSAEQGDAEAQNRLGDCYYHGKGVEQNYKEAVKWYRKSAEQGNMKAQNSLGLWRKIVK